MILAQTLSEYGVLTSMAAGIASARDRIERYIGPGNLKYVLLGLLAVFILLFVVQRRRA